MGVGRAETFGLTSLPSWRPPGRGGVPYFFQQFLAQHAMTSLYVKKRSLVSQIQAESEMVPRQTENPFAFAPQSI